MVFILLELCYISSQTHFLCVKTITEKVILDSTNTPMEVDFVPAKHLYMAENGKIGLCMAPGRKKKKKKHIWQRDLGQDLDRLQQVLLTLFIA